MTTTYRIGDLAREFDLTTRAIRFYEDLGLLCPQRTGPGGQQRLYSSRDRVRLKLTLRAKRLGLSLTQAKALIDMYESPRDSGPQLERFLQVLAEHRVQLQSRLAELQATLGEIDAHEREARALLHQLQQSDVANGASSGTDDANRRPRRRQSLSADG